MRLGAPIVATLVLLVPVAPAASSLASPAGAVAPADCEGNLLLPNALSPSKGENGCPLVATTEDCPPADPSPFACFESGVYATELGQMWKRVPDAQLERSLEADVGSGLAALVHGGHLYQIRGGETTLVLRYTGGLEGWRPAENLGRGLMSCEFEWSCEGVELTHPVVFEDPTGTLRLLEGSGSQAWHWTGTTWVQDENPDANIARGLPGEAEDIAAAFDWGGDRHLAVSTGEGQIHVYRWQSTDDRWVREPAMEQGLDLPTDGDGVLPRPTVFVYDDLLRLIAGDGPAYRAFTWWESAWRVDPSLPKGLADALAVKTPRTVQIGGEILLLSGDEGEANAGAANLRTAFYRLLDSDPGSPGE